MLSDLGLACGDARRLALDEPRLECRGEDADRLRIAPPGVLWQLVEDRSATQEW